MKMRWTESMCDRTSTVFAVEFWRYIRLIGYVTKLDVCYKLSIGQIVNHCLWCCQASVLVPSLLNMRDTLGKMLLDRLVPGEPPINISTPSMCIFAQKDLPSNIVGKQLFLGGTSVTLPPSLSNMTSGDTSSDSIGLLVRILKIYLIKFT